MKVVRYFAALLLSTSLMVGSGAVAAAPAPTPEQAVALAIKSLAPGERVVIQGLAIARTSEGRLAVDTLRPTIQTAATFCGTALAGAIFGIGAGILGVIAASTGSGTVMIAGYLLTGSQVGVLAGISGSYAALLGWISYNIC